MSFTSVVRRRRPTWVVVLALLVVSGAGGGEAQEVRPRIVNGTLTSGYPTTGALLTGTTVDTADTQCTGTLIGCRTFLTAQHCVEGETPERLKVFLQHGGMFDVESIALAPGYEFPVADIAVLTLALPVTGITPSGINTIEDPPYGTAGSIAGFGRSGGNNFDYGLKRAGAVVTSACPGGVSGATSVCWDFAAPLGDPGTNSNTCNADSGGPLFLDLGGETVVAGVTSGGSLDSCLTGDTSYDADVYHYRSFIQDAAGSDLGSIPCGEIAQVGDPDATVREFAGSISSKSLPQSLPMVHSFEVPEGVAVLRVALNGIDDGESDFDLYLRAGSAPTTTTFDCRRNGPNQFGVCEIVRPDPGTWFAMVEPFAGSGAYQVTATMFGGGCGDIIGDGEPCYDGDVCTNGEICQAGVCQGTPAAEGEVCGEGTLCSGPLTCRSGVCAADNSPRPACRQSLEPSRNFLQLRDETASTRDKMQWKWLKGEATSASSFGNPAIGTNYAMCIYDAVGGAPVLVMQHSLPAGLAWVPTNYGYRYTNSELTPDGISSVKLKSGVDGRASILVVGKGVPLEMTTLPLQQDGEVIVQMVNDADQCWEARYGSSRLNRVDTFKARGD